MRMIALLLAAALPSLAAAQDVPPVREPDSLSAETAAVDSQHAADSVLAAPQSANAFTASSGFMC